MKLDANGLGSQVISGTQISVRLSPYPPVAGQVSQVSIVGSFPSGQLALITPTLYITSDEADAPNMQQVNLQRTTIGSYEGQEILFPTKGSWRARIGFYLNSVDTSNIILLVAAK